MIYDVGSRNFTRFVMQIWSVEDITQCVSSKLPQKRASMCDMATRLLVSLFAYAIYHGTLLFQQYAVKNVEFMHGEVKKGHFSGGAKARVHSWVKIHCENGVFNVDLTASQYYSTLPLVYFGNPTDEPLYATVSGRNDVNTFDGRKCIIFGPDPVDVTTFKKPTEVLAALSLKHKDTEGILSMLYSELRMFD